MRAMAHPAFHLSLVGLVRIRGGRPSALSHGHEIPVAPGTPCGGRFPLWPALATAAAQAAVAGAQPLSGTAYKVTLLSTLLRRTFRSLA